MDMYVLDLRYSNLNVINKYKLEIRKENVC